MKVWQDKGMNDGTLRYKPLKNGDGDVTGVQYKSLIKGGAINIYLPKGTMVIAGRKEWKLGVMRRVESWTLPA